MLPSLLSVLPLYRLVYHWECLCSCTGTCSPDYKLPTTTNCRWRQLTAVTVESTNLWQGNIDRRHVRTPSLPSVLRAMLLGCILHVTYCLVLVPPQKHASVASCCAADYAECVDLLRKLVLTSLITLVPPGTIVQAFCQVLFSLVFMGIHVRIW